MNRFTVAQQEGRDLQQQQQPIGEIGQGLILMATLPGEERDEAQKTFAEYLQRTSGTHNMIISLTGWLSTPLMMCVRWDFGIRQLSWLRLIISGFVMVFVLGISEMWWAQEYPNGSWIGGKVIICYLLLVAVHRIRLHWRWRGGQVRAWHSHSTGRSIFEWLKIGDWGALRFLEPAVCLFCIVPFVSGIDPITGTWLNIAAWSLFLQNSMIHRASKHRTQDIMDMRILSAGWKKELQERTRMHHDTPAQASF